MAERRMFAKTIIDSDAFLDMPLSTQALYFHLSMRADDEGFVNKPKMIQRMVGCNDDDLKLLIAKKYLLAFESGVVVIKHWMVHNYIRKDRLVETMYKNEKTLLSTDESGIYSFGKFNDLLIPENVIFEESGEEKRKKAYAKSSLPYSFEYKIKQAFWNENCPVCGAKMQLGEFGVRANIPTVQHNIPIALGGEHEIENISVICLHCNTSIQDTPTDKLNNDLVMKKWDEISMTDECLTSDGQVTDKCPHRLGKVSIGKVSIEDVMPSAEKSAPVPSVIEISLNDKSMYPITQPDIDKWAKLYPAVEIMAELRKMVGWCDANPAKRKTKAGINRFINSWLSREHDRGGNKPIQAQHAQPTQGINTGEYV